MHLSSVLWSTLFLVASCATSGSPHGAPDAAPPRIERDNVGILLVDAQPAFWQTMHGAQEPVMERIEQLLRHASITEVPLVATFEHSPDWNGWLPERLEAVFPEHGHRLVKRAFDCCRESEIAEVLKSAGVDQWVVAGAETDVCVLQSVLGLLELGFDVFLLEDCVFTNEAAPEPALRRMYQAGAVPCTYKTFFFEMGRSVDRDALPDDWKQRLKVHEGNFKSPYRLTPRRE